MNKPDVPTPDEFADMMQSVEVPDEFKPFVMMSAAIGGAIWDSTNGDAKDCKCTACVTLRGVAEGMQGYLDANQG